MAVEMKLQRHVMLKEGAHTPETHPPAHETRDLALFDAGLEGREVGVNEVLLGDVGAEVVARVRLPALRGVLHAVGGVVLHDERTNP